jgi:hypothetical protein
MSETYENEMYERDGETNALVPVITLAGALQEGDRVTVKGNKLYKIDPLTNAEIPVVSAIGGDSDSGFMVPDYANKETVNRITAWDGTWTADRTGFVVCNIARNEAGYQCQIYMDNQLVGAVGAGAQSGLVTTIPIKKGQTLRLVGSTYGSWASAAYFVPPLFVKKELPVIVEKNGSYSLDEVKTADTWIDGKPVYKKTLSINNSNAHAVSANVDLGLQPPANMHRIIDYKYTVGIADANTWNTTFAYVTFPYLSVLKSGNLGFYTGNNSISGLQPNTGLLTLYYTKTTD